MKTPGPEDVAAAAARIRGAVHRTEVARSTYFDTLSGATLFFKCENRQKIGAFKARGALNAVRQLDPAAARRGIVTHSSGNHGQAVAWAAALHGYPATIVMPEDSARAKLDAVRGYGARIVLCTPGTKTREDALHRVLDESGGTLVHPYDNAHVIAGQGTAALELLEDVPDLDAIVTPVGGGGLISGTVLAATLRGGQTRVFGGEPANADDAARSLAARERLENDPTKQTIADGLRSSPVGVMNFAIMSGATGTRGVEAVVTVTEAEIVRAMRLLLERVKLVVEPSAAVSVAAVLKDKARFAGRRVGVVLSGGNVDLDRISALLALS